MIVAVRLFPLPLFVGIEPNECYPGLGRGVEEGTHYHTTTFDKHFATYKAFTNTKEQSKWLDEKYDAKSVLEMVKNVDI